MVPKLSVMGPTRKKRTLPCGRAPFVPAKYAVNACAWQKAPLELCRLTGSLDVLCT